MNNRVDKFEQMLTEAFHEEGALSADLISMTKEKLHHKRMENMRLNNKKPLTWVASILVGIMLTGGSVFAAWNLLTPSEVAIELGADSLGVAFDSEDVININETISSEGYKFTLLSIVTGDKITDTLVFNSDEICTDRMYVVIAIRSEDGTSMYESTSTFFSSPYVNGFAPWKVNIASLGNSGGGGQERIIDGVLYRLIDMQNMESFAAHGIYLGISLGTFSFEAFNFDPEPGTISLNSKFDGPSVLFELPLDISLADEDRVQEILAANFVDVADDEEIDDIDEGFESKIILGFDDGRSVTLYDRDMDTTVMNYDELADFLEARIQMYIANGNPQTVISGARRDKADQLRTMRTHNIEFANVWYDDDLGAISISFVFPDQD